MSKVVQLACMNHTSGKHAPEPAIIHTHDFKSVYQPILSPTHQKLVGYEALVRVSRNKHPVSPIDLFEQAANLDQIPELDRYLLNLHLSGFSAGDNPVWLFLNINPHTCTDPEASLERLAQQCERMGTRPEKVVLELVETASDNPGALMEFIHKAKGLGFQIAIDDFGMGDSNFERLWRINPLIVKLDRSLLVNAEHNNRARLLLESLVRMIRESGSLVLLEGIENGAQARIALDTEADLLQGFLFARPGAITKKTVERSESRLASVVTDSREWWIQDSKDQESYLRLLHFEIMDACHRIVRNQPFNETCRILLEMDGVKRCFLLDSNGIQQGNLAHAGQDTTPGGFNPLYRSAGASWGHREYFRNAQERPQHINSSRPYVALPDARRTVTLSTALPTESGQQVFCVDVHPDEVFNGQLYFPATI
ncbi:EAL domain-containing protein [Marinobacter sp. 1_MG-2023]|uniref:sensor domain-containing phosphodiesterase n=1 Tax=Marinobacter sp. 1_MG-2023 TaxID=3062627 RepID=UPI0026E353DB|nr:EAL domain-containing protein [Marinobacter sp. 1_MG-2023]MDO6824861.1 EAL domain-containing protein [Marinobacter sp. 1_MG-2023]